MNIPKLRFKDNNGNDYPQWEKKKLGDLVSIKTGISPTNILDEYGSIPYFKVEQLNNSNKYQINTPYKTKNNQKLIPPKSIIFPKRGISILSNKIRILSQYSLIDTNIMALIVKNNSTSNEFLYYFLLNEDLSKIADTTSIPQINNKHIEPYNIYLPLLDEQEKIANFLTTVDKKIENLANTITCLENQKKGLLQQIFSQKLRFKDKNGNNYLNWEKKKIGLICSISTGKSNTQDKIDNGKYPFYVRSATIERSSKYLYDEEATLTVGDGVGTGKVFHYVNGKYDLHQRCYRMFNFKNTHAKYFYYFFSSHFYNRVKRMSAKNSVDSVRMNMISDMIIDLPCLEEQTKIADFLSAFDRKLENQKAQLEHWKQIKKGLLQQMFV